MEGPTFIWTAQLSSGYTQSNVVFVELKEILHATDTRNFMVKGFFEKLIVTKQVKKYPACYGT